MKSTKLRSWTEAVFGLQPLASPPHVFALDDDHLLYARFLVDGVGRPQLLERVVVPVPEGVLQTGSLGGHVEDPEAMKQLIGDLVDRLSSPTDKAALVVPDSWLRMTFLDTEELPVADDARLEVLRWKMSRLLPFKVEDLRIDTQQVESLPGQEGPVRTVIGFARERLLEEFESAFAAANVELGCITNRSSGLMLALSEELAAVGLAAIVLVEETHYTLVAARRGEPILFRHKALEGEASVQEQSVGILRDLRLTRGFLSERLGDEELDAVELVSVPSQRAQWQEWLSAGLGREARFHDFDTTTEGRSLSAVMGAMSGVVIQEIR